MDCPCCILGRRRSRSVQRGGGAPKGERFKGDRRTASWLHFLCAEFLHSSFLFSLIQLSAWRVCSSRLKKSEKSSQFFSTLLLFFFFRLGFWPSCKQMLLVIWSLCSAGKQLVVCSGFTASNITALLFVFIITIALQTKIVKAPKSCLFFS